MNDPTNWNPQGEFDALTFASYTDAKKAEVLFNRLVSERQQAETDKNWLRAQRDTAEEKLSARPEALQKTVEIPSEAQHNLRDKILAERDKGNVVFWGLPDQLMTASLEEFVKQPADGILYDLNRLEEVCLTFITDKKWVNDFAVAMVIRKLVEQRNASVPSPQLRSQEKP